MKAVFLSAYPIDKIDNIVFKKNADTKNIHPATWIVSTSKALVDYTDIELHIITLSNLIPFNQTFNENGVKIHVLKQLSHGNLVMLGIPNILKILKKLKLINPDIVHSHGTESIYSLAGVTSGFPCIITLQGIVSELYKKDPNLSRFVHQYLEKYAIKSGRYFICSTSAVEEFVNRTTIKPIIFRISNPVHNAFFDQSKGNTIRFQPNILFVGAICKLKGIEELCCAFNIIRRKIPNVKLKIIGSGNKHYISSKLFPILDRNEIRNHIEFLGKKSSEDVAFYMSKATVFVLPSYEESFGLVNAEAMAVGLPVVSTNVGGISDVVKDRKTGFLVEPKNVEELAGKIIQLLESPELRKNMGERAKEEARNRFHPKMISKKTYEVYQKVLELESVDY